eukprot:43613-Pelagomonas_calceolata.AAC.1
MLVPSRPARSAVTQLHALQGKQAHAATPSQKKRLPLHKRVLKAITPGKVKKPPQNGIAIVATNDGNKDGGPVEQGREREGGERVKGRVGSFQGSNTKGSKHGADPSHNSKHTSFFSSVLPVISHALSCSHPCAWCACGGVLPVLSHSLIAAAILARYACGGMLLGPRWCAFLAGCCAESPSYDAVLHQACWVSQCEREPAWIPAAMKLTCACAHGELQAVRQFRPFLCCSKLQNPSWIIGLRALQSLGWGIHELIF